MRSRRGLPSPEEKSMKKIFIKKNEIKNPKLLSEKHEKNHIKFKKSAQIPGQSSPLSVCSIIWGQDDLTFPFILNLHIGGMVFG